MADPVNLRAARKRKQRAEKEVAAAANRASFGRRPSEKTAAGLSRALEERRLESHRLIRATERDEKR